MTRYLIDGIIYDNTADARDAVTYPDQRIDQLNTDGTIDNIPASDIPSADPQADAYYADNLDTLYRTYND